MNIRKIKLIQEDSKQLYNFQRFIHPKGRYMVQISNIMDKDLLKIPHQNT